MSRKRKHQSKANPVAQPEPVVVCAACKAPVSKEEPQCPSCGATFEDDVADRIVRRQNQFGAWLYSRVALLLGACAIIIPFLGFGLGIAAIVVGKKALRLVPPDDPALLYWSKLRAQIAIGLGVLSFPVNL